MPVEARWYDQDKHVILFTFSPIFTVAEYHEALDVRFRLTSESALPYAVILDLTPIRRLPSNAIAEIRRAQERALSDPYYRFTVALGTGSTFRVGQFLVDTMRRVGLAHLFEGKVYFVNTYAQAHEVITEQLALDDLHPLEDCSTEEY